MNDIRIKSTILTAVALLAAVLVACASPTIAPATVTTVPQPIAAPSVATETTGGAGLLADDETATLGSLKRVDDYPLYTMQYVGAYRRASAPLELSIRPAHQEQDDNDRSEELSPVTRHPSASLRTGSSPVTLPWGCSLFAAFADTGNMLYGRNFDWDYSPALLLFTSPPNGYASVSMVDIAFLGFDGARAKAIADLPLAERRALLNATTLPFDGMNERGLVVGMAAVPPGDMRRDPSKRTIGSLGVIRAILDRASSVDEAVSIFQGYNIDFTGGPPIHYLIADRAGRAVLVEFYRGEMVVMPNTTAWHLATNFLRASVGESAQGACWRYDALSARLAETRGRLATQDALALLARVAQPGTQWSIVYGISTCEIVVTMGRQYDNVHKFDLKFTGR